MAQVFAGFACGFGLSLISAPLLAMVLLSMRANSPLLARFLPPGVSPVALAVTLHFTMMLFWTGLGIVFGLLLLALSGAPSGLGSANLPFTALVISLTLLWLTPLLLLVPRFRRIAILIGGVTVLAFGWLMPYMAEWSRFET